MSETVNAKTMQIRNGVTNYLHGSNTPLWAIIAGIILSLLCGYSLVNYGTSAPFVIIAGLCSMALIARPYYALCIIIMLIGLEAVNTISEQDVYNLTGIKLLGVVLAFSLVPALAIGKLRIRLGLESVAISIFIITMIASLFNVENSEAALKSSLTFIQLIVLWLAIRLLVNSRIRVEIIARIIAITMTVSAVIGIWQFYNNPSLRITGVSQNAAVLSSDLLVAFWFLVALTYASFYRVSKIVWFVLFTIVSLAVLYSLSRAAYLAVIPSILVAGLYCRKFFKSVILSAVLLILVISFAPFVLNRLSETSVMEDRSTKGHYYSIVSGVDMMLDNPLFGVGIGNYSEHYLRYTNDERYIPRTAHSSYIAIGAEMGILSLIAYVLLHVFAYFSLWKNSCMMKKENDRRGLFFLAAIAGALTCITIIGLFHSLQFSKFLWILLALSIKFPIEQKVVVKND